MHVITHVYMHDVYACKHHGSEWLELWHDDYIVNVGVPLTPSQPSAQVLVCDQCIMTHTWIINEFIIIRVSVPEISRDRHTSVLY